MARILLSDDQAAARDLVCRALEMDGHSVAITEEGAEALDKVKTGDGFDLLITDVEMPVMDGISLAHEAIAAAPSLRVILISGHQEQLQRAAGLDGRSLRTLTKPFTLEQIRAEVAAALAD